MSDLISRQEVIIALRESGLCYNNWLDVISVIDGVPNAKRHIENGDLMIIVAGECEPDLGYTHLYKVIENIPSADIEEDVARRIATIIENEQDMRVILKNAEPKEVYCSMASRACFANGKEVAWCLTCPHISEEDRELVKKAVEGSECKRIDDKYSVANFCWYCGAKMRGEE